MNRQALILLKPSVTWINERERAMQGHLQRPCLQTLEKGVNALAEQGGAGAPSPKQLLKQTS